MPEFDVRNSEIEKKHSKIKIFARNISFSIFFERKAVVCEFLLKKQDKVWFIFKMVFNYLALWFYKDLVMNLSSTENVHKKVYKC